jgi:putative AbiEii toxin of type IV toxin-antitoxin system
VIVEFKNLARVAHTRLDLKPLTIIIGPNNSHKTYIAYSVYGLLDKSSKYHREDRRHYKIRHFKDGSIRLKVGKGLVEAMWDFSWDRSYPFNRRIDEFYQDSSHAIFKGSESRLQVSLADIKEALTRMNGKQGPVSVSLQGDVLIVRQQGAARTPTSAFFRYVLPVLQRHIFPKPYVLPAERTGLILVYRSLLAHRYKALRETQRSLFSEETIDRERLNLLRGSDIAFPQPLEQFLDFLTEVELAPRKETRAEPNQFQLLADRIELGLQEGNRTVLHPTKLSQEIRVNVRDDLSIDLHNASSSIKQLASLLLYLRYGADKGDLLIIDEPEINLHPESQVKLLEVFGILVNLGVKVLITTHSPYFMAHLNSLVSGSTSDAATLAEQASSLYLGDARAFLPVNMVSAYEMKDYKLNSLIDDEYGIRWDSLSDVSADVQQKYFQIYEKGKAATNGKKRQKHPRAPEGKD